MITHPWELPTVRMVRAGSDPVTVNLDRAHEWEAEGWTREELAAAEEAASEETVEETAAPVKKKK